MLRALLCWNQHRRHTEFMHLRNPYRTPPDFVQLAEAYPLLKPFVFSNKQGAPFINFKDASGQRYLTEALLRRDFNLRWEIPHDRICPAVPNRLNYVLWIQDIMTASPSRNDVVRGIDIGTGASVIYPLLACSLSPNWTFIATDIDQESLMAAEKNITFNSLQNRIVLAQVDSAGPIIQRLFEDQRIQECDFLMCNPPFYTSKEEMAKAAEDKEFDPNAVCTGADVEMITPGGERQFVGQIVQESVFLGTRCRWYTSLLGKHSSIASIVELFRSLKIDNYGITEFVQGHTRRWGVAWSFGNDRLPDTLVRETSESLHSLLPLPNNLRQNLTSNTQISTPFIVNLLEELCRELDGVGFSLLSNELTSKDAIIRVWAKENTWSRKARRRLERMKKENATMNVDLSSTAVPESDANVVLLVRCFNQDNTGQNEAESWSLEASWVRGRDRELFEGLWSHLSRKVLDSLV